MKRYDYAHKFYNLKTPSIILIIVFIKAGQAIARISLSTTMRLTVIPLALVCKNIKLILGNYLNFRKS